MRWRFGGASSALRTGIGHRDGDMIVTHGNRGCALHGPYLEVPAGWLHARILLGPDARVAQDFVFLSPSGAQDRIARG